MCLLVAVWQVAKLMRSRDRTGMQRKWACECCMSMKDDLYKEFLVMMIRPAL